MRRGLLAGTRTARDVEQSSNRNIVHDDDQGGHVEQTVAADRDLARALRLELRDACVVTAIPAPATPAPQPARPPFAYVVGSPRDFFAQDNDALARYVQQERTPGWGVHADVAAGPAEEWIMDVFQYAFVVSPEAGGFWYRDFGKGDVSHVDAQPLTHGAKKDVIVRYQLSEGEFPNGYRHDIVEVWSFGADGPVVRLALEIGAQAMCCGSEANAPPRMASALAVRPDSIVVVAEKPWRVDAKFQPTTPAGVLPMVKEGEPKRTYRWDGSSFRSD